MLNDKNLPVDKINERVDGIKRPQLPCLRNGCPLTSCLSILYLTNFTNKTIPYLCQNNNSFVYFNKSYMILLFNVGTSARKLVCNQELS